MFGICIKAGATKPGIWKTLDVMPDIADSFLGEVGGAPDPGEYREVSFPEWYETIQEARKARDARGN